MSLICHKLTKFIAIAKSSSKNAHKNECVLVGVLNIFFPCEKKYLNFFV